MSGIVIGIKPHLLRDFLIYLEISLFEMKGRIVKPKCLVKMFALINFDISVTACVGLFWSGQMYVWIRLASVYSSQS